MNYKELGQILAQTVRADLVANLRQSGLVGETLTQPDDLKSTHRTDEIATRAVLRVLEPYPCNIFIESLAPRCRSDAKFSIFIDPLDGSLNWDRGCGDPCIAIAISERIESLRLVDLTFAYVEGLRSGDFYYTHGEATYFFHHLLQQEFSIYCQGPSQLSKATAYIRFGYSLASHQLENSLPILLNCRDMRAIDNTSIELCEIARNAADLLVEARGRADPYTLLAYPIVKYAGAFICDCDGNSIEQLPLDENERIDFVICNNPDLLREVIELCQQLKRSRQYSHDTMRFSF